MAMTSNTTRTGNKTAISVAATPRRQEEARRTIAAPPCGERCGSGNAAASNACVAAGWVGRGREAQTPGDVQDGASPVGRVPTFGRTDGREVVGITIFHRSGTAVVKSQWAFLWTVPIVLALQGRPRTVPPYSRRGDGTTSAGSPLTTVVARTLPPH